MSRFAALLILLLAAAISAPAARAQDRKYPLDWSLDDCRSRESGNTALAVTDFGQSWCAWDFPTAAAAQRAAPAGCRRSVPAALRKAANCAIIYENGRIVDDDRASRMRRDIRMPARIESYNGAAGTTEIHRGFITLGAAPDLTLRTAVVSLADGTEICVGSARFSGNLRSRFAFTAGCFGDQVFRGEAVLTGLVRIDGLNRPGFDLLIRNPPHGARIVTD